MKGYFDLAFGGSKDNFRPRFSTLFVEITTRGSPGSPFSPKMKTLRICVSLIFLVKTIESSILHSNTQFNLAVPAILKENVNLRINECGFAYQLLKPGATGEIITPNYPMDYPPNLNCIWWLKSIPKTNIHLKCYDVQTQSCTPDLFDYFLVSPDWTWKQYSM